MWSLRAQSQEEAWLRVLGFRALGFRAQSLGFSRLGLGVWHLDFYGFGAVIQGLGGLGSKPGNSCSRDSLNLMLSPPRTPGFGYNLHPPLREGSTTSIRRS